MAATGDEGIDSLLTSLDQIYEDYKGGMEEIQYLKSNWKAEVNKREALQLTCNNLKRENDRLSKLCMASLNDLPLQLQLRTKCQTLNDELQRVTSEHLKTEDEHKKAMEALKQTFTTRVGDLEAKIRGSLFEKATSEATINHLRQDLAAHKAHVQTLAKRLEQVHYEVESKYNLEIQDLKDCCLVEQEEKNELKTKLRDLEKELLICKTKLVEQQHDSAPNHLVEALKQKIMKLRKENEILKRKLPHSEDG